MVCCHADKIIGPVSPAPVTMVQVLATELAQAISNYVDEKGIVSPQEISVTIETMPLLTWPEINVGPLERKDGIISAKIKLPGKEHN